MGKELNSNYYNKTVEKKDAKYRKNPEQLLYFTLWSEGIKYFKLHNFKNIVDIGCGAGQFAKMLKDDNKIILEKYIGYDFSDKRLEIAKKFINNDTRFNFKQVDLRNYDINQDLLEFNTDDTLIVCFEFLEHINNDLKILKSINNKYSIICSVPSYDSKGHVRFFKNKKQVDKRYSSIIKYDMNIIPMGNGRVYIMSGKLI